MKQEALRKMMSAFLALIMLIGVIPIATPMAHAGHKCPDCEDWIDGSPYCSECYVCDACNPLCVECGVCSECSGSAVCDACSDEEIGATICVECAIEKGSHCPNCDECYFEVQQWCEECGACADCIDICEGCSNNLGEGILCEECVLEKGSHCPDCGECYFKIQGWCEECLRCTECVPTCEYCSTEQGMIICEECSIEEGLHCPDCNECYGNSDGQYCGDCGICAACIDFCDSHELCIGCAIDSGAHCPYCEACDEDAVICEDCGEVCSECANDFCEDCNLCDGCAEAFCSGCGACSNCADVCPNCGEYCSDCEDICSDCGYCVVCCADLAQSYGCDCDDWVCTESSDWDEHLEENHTDTETEENHSLRPAAVWQWDEDSHWHGCVYCDESAHYTNVSKHTYNSAGTCTVCGCTKNAKIHILEQPADSRYAYVQSANETPDERNIAHFSVKAVGNSELTYEWHIGHYVNGSIKYRPLTGEPSEGEHYDGPKLDVLTYTDSCYSDCYVCCFITDEEGNEVRTADALLQARHDFQYYKWWKTHERPYPNVERNQYGHTLQCVGEGCENTAILRPHEDVDRDYICDICDYKIGSILITKQPKNATNVYVSSSREYPDESNFAHFSLEAVGESELTYTWCRRQYVNGKLTYVPLSNPQDGEDYEGPDAAILAPEDSCCNTYLYACIVSDEEGNEVKSLDVQIKAKHNYQYFIDYGTTQETPYPGLLRLATGHFVQCVGTDCDEKTKFRRHGDENNDFLCDICGYRKVIDEVKLTVTPPVEGQTPKYTVGCGSSAYAVNGRMNNGIYWFESDTGEDGSWKLISNTATFRAGKYYKFSVDLKTASGYVFDKHSDSVTGVDYNSKVIARVNGNTTWGQKTYGKELAHYITVEYVFGECPDSLIENIVIENVTLPVADKKPAYTATIRGSGYQIDTSKNAYEDIYWKNPAEKWYYIKNGIGWFDLTKGDWVYDHETFVPGHKYEITVYLKVEDGFQFKNLYEHDELPAASVNGYGATVNESWSNASEARVYVSFACGKKDISTVMVYVDEPQAGKTPGDCKVTVAYPDLYRLDPNYAGTGGIVWYDSDGDMLEPTDPFLEDESYRIEVKVIPAQRNGADVTQFVAPGAAYVNGNQVTERLDWDAVYADSNAVHIYYTFFNAGFTQQPQGDILQVGEWKNVTWETSFVPDMTEIQYWDGQVWDQWDVQYPQDAYDDYDFGGTDGGTYRFRIAAYLGEKIAAVSNAFTITWKEPVSAVWKGDTCTVTLEQPDLYETVMAAVYDDGQLVDIVKLTKENPTAKLTGFLVKVFFLDDSNDPARAHLEF